MGNSSSRSVASSKPGRISASEYQIKTFAAAIDKNFLRAQDGQQVSIQTPNNHFQRPVSHPVDEYNLLPGPPDGDDGGLQQTERKARQHSFEGTGDEDEEPRLQMPREGVSRQGSELDGSAKNDGARSGSNSEQSERSSDSHNCAAGSTTPPTYPQRQPQAALSDGGQDMVTIIDHGAPQLDDFAHSVNTSHERGIKTSSHPTSRSRARQ